MLATAVVTFLFYNDLLPKSAHFAVDPLQIFSIDEPPLTTTAAISINNSHQQFPSTISINNFFLILASLDPVTSILNVAVATKIVSAIDAKGGVLDMSILHSIQSKVEFLIPEVIVLVETFGWSRMTCSVLRFLADRVLFYNEHTKHIVPTLDRSLSEHNFDYLAHETFFCVDGQTRPCRKPRENTNGHKLQKKDNCFDKKFPDSTRHPGQRGGLLVFICLRTMRIIGFHVLEGAETVNIVGRLIYTWFPQCPKLIFYDYGCALVQYFLSHEPQYFLQNGTQIFSDSFHWGTLFSGHKCSIVNTI